MFPKSTTPQCLPVNTTLRFLFFSKTNIPLEVIIKKSRVNISSGFRKRLLTFNSSYIRNRTCQGVTIQGGYYHYHYYCYYSYYPTSWKFAWENFSLHLIFASVDPKPSA